MSHQIYIYKLSHKKEVRLGFGYTAKPNEFHTKLQSNLEGYGVSAELVYTHSVSMKVVALSIERGLKEKFTRSNWSVPGFKQQTAAVAELKNLINFIENFEEKDSSYSSNALAVRAHRASKRLGIPSNEIDMGTYNLISETPTDYQKLYKLLTEYKAIKIAMRASNKSLEDVLSSLNNPPTQNSFTTP